MQRASKNRFRGGFFSLALKVCSGDGEKKSRQRGRENASANGQDGTTADASPPVQPRENLRHVAYKGSIAIKFQLLRPKSARL